MDKNVSPVGWYVASYLLRFVELEDGDNEDPDRRFLSWENTVLVQASNLDKAYSKVAKIGRSFTKPYLGGHPPGVKVRWLFEGVTSITPMYEALGDGVEVSWQQHTSRKLATLRKWVKPKGSFKQ